MYFFIIFVLKLSNIKNYYNYQDESKTTNRIRFLTLCHNHGKCTGAEQCN